MLRSGDQLEQEALKWPEFDRVVLDTLWLGIRAVGVVVRPDEAVALVQVAEFELGMLVDWELVSHRLGGKVEHDEDAGVAGAALVLARADVAEDVLVEAGEEGKLAVHLGGLRTVESAACD